jgi:hypothetical protein
MRRLQSSAAAISAALRSRAAAWILFAVLLALGLWVAGDYGISWDEKAMYVLGEEAYNYVFHAGAYPTHPGIRFHGAWFEILQHAAEELLHLPNARDVFILRHMMDYVFYWTGLVAMYLLALRSFRHRGWALVTTLFLFFSPRIFGHAFVNARDIPAMTCFIIKMCALLYFLERPTVGRAALLGIASGFVMAIRIGGLFVPLYVGIFFGLLIVHDLIRGKPVPWGRYALALAVYAAAFTLSTVALWPLLWVHPLGNFLDAVRNMTQDQQQPGGFYLGHAVTALPWHWIPVQIVTKTPVLYVALFLVGVAELAFTACRRPLALLEERRDALLFFLWFALPVCIVILLHGDLFDEWRHLYFIYPAIILLAVHGLRTLWLRASRLRNETMRHWARGGLILLCALQLGRTAVWMVRNHPLEYVYFSLPSRWVEGQFALDYWGLSYRQGFEWILRHDPSDLITVSVTSSPGWENLNILTPEERRRIVVRSNTATKYVLDNFHETQYRHTLPAETMVHAIRVAGMDVLGIYRNPYWDPSMDSRAERMEDTDVQLRFDQKSTP